MSVCARLVPTDPQRQIAVIKKITFMTSLDWGNYVEQDYLRRRSMRPGQLAGEPSGKIPPGPGFLRENKRMGGAQKFTVVVAPAATSDSPALSATRSR